MKILLTPERYIELLDRIKRLEGLVEIQHNEILTLSKALKAHEEGFRAVDAELKLRDKPFLFGRW